MSEIQIEKIRKTFDDFVAVEESDLTINNGEFFGFGSQPIKIRKSQRQTPSRLMKF